RAIQEYVRHGGKLIICQPGQRDAATPWGDLLPVEVTDIVDRTQPEPISTIALKHLPESRLTQARALWQSANGPFKVARATTRPNTLVDEYVRWDQTGKDQTPWLVRMPYGAGCVTWVAQDLSVPALIRQAKPGWPHIWDKIFDLKNDTLIIDNSTSENEKAKYKNSTRKDLGRSLDSLMELQSKSRNLVLIAVVFFIAYWVVAGPGVYVVLAAKGKAHLSWFLFALSAIGATAITVLVVRVVVRGDPELHHV